MSGLNRRVLLASTVALCLALAGARPALAHAELVASDPSSGEVLDVAPEEVVITFDGEITNESTFTVEDASGDDVGGGELDLDVVERNVLRGSVEIEEAGDYLVRWAVTAAGDRDQSTGEFTFSVRTGAPSSDEPSASTRPDTALGPAAWVGPDLKAAGALLLGAGLSLAIAASVRRRRRAEG